MCPLSSTFSPGDSILHDDSCWERDSISGLQETEIFCIMYAFNNSW